MGKADSPVLKPQAVQVRFEPIAGLVPYARNARVHSDAQVAQVAASIREFGWTNPVLVDEAGGIIAGHCRVLAAQSLGMESVPVIELAGLSDAKKRAYILADNRLALNAGWNEDLLALELDELRDEVDLSLVGFTPDELNDLIGTPNTGFDPDEVPPEPVVPVTKPGDLWLLGEHRLLCGDSTKAEDVALVMGGEKATLLFTDPPYGVSIGAKNRMLNSFQKAGKNLTDIVDDNVSEKDLREMLLAAFKLARTQCADDCSVFVCSPQGGTLGLMMMMMMMMEAGLTIRHIVNWQKNAPTFSMGRLDYEYQHEPILFTWIKTHKRIKGGPFQTSLWPVDKPRASPEHPTMKPVALPANAILNHTDAGDVVFDNFLGSGTTMIAAEQHSRRCRGLEIAPAYCDVIIIRWQNFTGKRATHAVTGEQFPTAPAAL